MDIYKMVTMLSFLLCLTAHAGMSKEDVKKEPYLSILKAIASGKEYKAAETLQDRNSAQPLRSEFLEGLLTGQYDQLEIDPVKKTLFSIPHQGVQIINATFEGKLNLIAANIPCEVWLDGCVFKDSIMAHGCRFGESITFYDAIFHGDVCLQYSLARVNMMFVRATFKNEANFISVCARDLSFVEANFESDFTVCDGRVEQTNCRLATFGGKVDFANLKATALSFKQAKFIPRKKIESEDEYNFQSMRIEGDMSLDSSRFEFKSNFKNTRIGGWLSSENAGYYDDVSFTSCAVTGHVSFKSSEFRATTLFSEFSCISLDLSEIQTQYGLNMENIRVSRDLDISKSIWGKGSNKKPSLFLDGSRIAGEVEISFGNGESLNKLSLEGVESSSISIVTANGNSISTLDISNISMDGNLTVKGFKLNEFRARGIRCEGIALIKEITIEEKNDPNSSNIDLSDATFGSLGFKVTNNIKEKNLILSVKISGLKYRHLDTVDGQKTWEVLRWILSYSQRDDARATYLDLHDYLILGDDETAAFRVKRDLYWPKSWCHFGEWFYYGWGLFTRFGRFPWCVFMSEVLLIGLGAFIFNKFGICSTKENTAVKPGTRGDLLDSLWLSFDVAIPFFELKVKDKWEIISGSKVWINYHYLQSIFGLILISLFISVLAGILK